MTFVESHDRAEIRCPPEQMEYSADNDTNKDPDSSFWKPRDVTELEQVRGGERGSDGHQRDGNSEMGLGVMCGVLMLTDRGRWRW